MRNLDLLTEVGALAGYTLTGGTGQDAINKLRAQRRLTIIKADVIGRYADWPALYREGWLALTPLYVTGTVTVTQGSNTVTGSGTTWTVAMKGRKFIGPDGAAYKIASFVSTTSLVLTAAYQGNSDSAKNYSIWQDEYRLYPEVRALGGFTDYAVPSSLRESQPKDVKASFPNETQNTTPDIFVVIGREPLTSSYATGTVSCAVNTNVWTGVGTSWLANLEPGMSFVVGAYTYHVKKINSDTELETYQLAAVVASATTYSAIGRNALIVRFRAPATQRIVSYWYWAKDYPLVNDSDEDWFCEMYPKVLLNGIAYYDYMDKNDPIRMDRSSMAYENSIKDMHVAVLNAYTGVRTLQTYIPQSAWE